MSKNTIKIFVIVNLVTYCVLTAEMVNRHLNKTDPHEFREKHMIRNLSNPIANDISKEEPNV